jgi:hypothetical protein
LLDALQREGIISSNHPASGFFRAVVTQSYLLIPQGIASIFCLVFSFLLEPMEPSCTNLNLP